MQLLGSFISTTSDYSLARLEFAMRHPSVPAPPIIERLTDASEMTLLTEWDRIERQLELARRYLKRVDDSRGKRAELDQYARAVRWVMTVDDRPRP